MTIVASHHARKRTLRSADRSAPEAGGNWNTLPPRHRTVGVISLYGGLGRLHSLKRPLMRLERASSLSHSLGPQSDPGEDGGLVDLPLAGAKGEAGGTHSPLNESVADGGVTILS